MSKPKKNQKKTPQAKAAAAAAKKAEEKKKIDPKTVKAVLIALAAVVAVAAIVLLAIFVIKPAIEENIAKKPDNTVTTTRPYEEGDEFLPVEYNGLSVPAVFADILKEAESEREGLCAQYGVALEVGDIKISRPEFNMYYYDKYIEQYRKVQQSINSNGANLTGFNLSKTPEEQKYIQGDSTWADYFTYEATAAIQKTYADYRRACEAGTELTPDAMQGLIDAYDQIKYSAEEKEQTEDEYMSAMYTEGVDYSMFFARVLMDNYAAQFRTDENKRLFDSCSEDEIQKRYDENPMKYKVAKVRVYLIEGEYDAAEAAAVKNEEEFIEYAANNMPYENFDADLDTEMGWIAYPDLEAYHGETVANWAFDSERVRGEIGVVEDFLGRYIIFVEEPAFNSYTYQIISFRYEHQNLSNHEPALLQATDFYGVWKAGEQTEESFRELAQQTGYFEEDAAVITRYDLELADWFSDPARKYGDTFYYDGSDAAYVVYFLHANPEDLDWKTLARSEIGEENFEKQFAQLIKNDYKTEINQNMLKQSYKTVNDRAAKYFESQNAK